MKIIEIIKKGKQLEQILADFRFHGLTVKEDGSYIEIYDGDKFLITTESHEVLEYFYLGFMAGTGGENG